MMHRRISKSSVLGAFTLVASLAGGCAIEDGRDGSEGAERGTWQSSAKADETSTCTNACGAQAIAGCWCDASCAEYGDCCPDKAAVCDGAGAGEAPPAAGNPGDEIGSFELTYYWVTEESAYGGADTTKLYDDSCNVLSSVPAGFASAIKLEGTGRLTDGRVLNYSGACDCPSSPCYFEVDAAHPWGFGVENKALTPFRSIAVDKSVVPYGTKLYIEKLDGVTMPGEAPWGGFVHDGCVSADDTGSAIIGKHLDFFSARKADYLSLNAVLNTSHVTVREGGERCAEGGGGGAPVPPPAGGGGSELCFPGPANDHSVCVPLVAAATVGSGYSYPAPLSGNVNYRAPIAFIDLESVGDIQVSANFKLGEVAQASKGRYAVVQPHAIERLQGLRNELGAIGVNSGYRSPSYNASIDGATHSRHMYGDGFDLAPQSVSLGTLESACTSHGGTLVEYTSHVHCDWRNDALDTKLYGSPALGEPHFDLGTSPFAASLHRQEGLWIAPALGFDEGEPMRRWTALDADGEVIYEATGESFAAPTGTATVEVLVGAQLELTADVR